MKHLRDLSLPNRRDVQRLLDHLPIHPDRRPRAAAGDPRFWSGVGLGIALGGGLVALTHGPGAAERRESLRRRVTDIREKGSKLAHSEGEIEASVVIGVPVKVAYDQWTQFEQFPRFMEGILDVRQETDRQLHWKAEIGGKAVEWESEIVEQIPDKRIAWRDLGSRRGGGVVTFHHLSDETCKVMVQIAYETQGPLEQVGDSLGLVRRRVRGDLDRFRDFIEGRAEATGGYRKAISQVGGASTA